MAGITDAIDIVVLNCGNEEYIRRCIHSIKANTAGRYNLIVVDQNSKDGSRQWLVENEVAGHLVLCDKNVGVGQGRNRGIEVGRFPWIAMIDSDVEIRDPEWLDKMWNYVIDDHIGLIEARVENENGAASFGALSFCMVRRECLHDIGRFDSHFYIGEDQEWFARLEWSRWKTGYCYSTDVLHIGGRTLQGCIRGKLPELLKESRRLLNLKYSQDFLERTVGEHERRRLRKQEELLGHLSPSIN